MAFSANLWKNGIDMHTVILNYLYALYVKSYGYANLADIGYWGNPDPHLGAVTPDFISCGTNGDIQIIDVKSFYRDDIKRFEYDCTDVAQKLEEVYAKYNALTPLEILPYLNLHKAERDPKIIEIVFVFPNKVFEECLPIIRTKISKNLIIWTFDFSNNPPILRKVLGNHNQQVLEDAVQACFNTSF